MQFVEAITATSSDRASSVAELRARDLEIRDVQAKEAQAREIQASIAHAREVDALVVEMQAQNVAYLMINGQPWRVNTPQPLPVGSTIRVKIDNQGRDVRFLLRPEAIRAAARAQVPSESFVQSQPVQAAQAAQTAQSAQAALARRAR